MKRRYFTLLEVVLAALVIAIGMGAIWGFFSVYANQKRKALLEIKIDRNLRETVALYEIKLIRGDSFFNRDEGDEEKRIEIAKEELFIDGLKVIRIVQVGVKRAEDGKEALVDLVIIYKHPLLPKGKRKEHYHRYVSFNAN